MRKILSMLLALAMVFSCMSTVAFAEDAAVAKIGNTEYATIDEAIANWTNGTTLTLLSDVTLTDVIKLSSTEYHILDLGTYTMTAASGKDAIQYVVNGRSSASYALDIKADAQNPGGITATGKTIVSHIMPSSNAPSKDRPITRFYGGVFNASYVVKQGGTSSWGLLTSGYTGASAPYFQFYGGVYNGTIYTNRSQNQFHGGTFNGSMQMSVDTSAYTMVAGGTFKNLSNSMGSSLNSDKFTIGSSKGANNGSVCIDENGNYVISTTTPTVAEASVASNYNSSNYFYYSTVNTNGMYYEDVYDALEGNKTGVVTVLTDELDLSDTAFKGTIVVPEGEEVTIVVAEGTTPAWTIKSAVENEEPNVTYKDADNNDLVKNEDGAFVEAGPAWEGEGTEEAPYLIEDVAGLIAFQTSVNSGKVNDKAYFKLTKDINLADTSAIQLLSDEVTSNWTPIGTSENPFTGTFDGDGKTISNLIVVGGANQGFIGYADKATIKNIKIENATVSGTDCVGAIAGQVYSESLIDNCHVSGNIQITGQTNVGGIVGKYYTKVSNSSVIGDGTDKSFVKGVYQASDFEGDNVGGIMGHGGENNNFVGNTVKNITVSGTRKIGGIVGTTDRATDLSGCVVENVILETTATEDYAAGNAGTMALGGLIGHYYGNNTGGTVNDSTVENISFVKEYNVTIHAGAIVGNNRTTPNAPVEGVTTSNITVTDVTGATNNYLQPTVTYVAEVNGVSYETLEEALKALTSGATLTLLDNITIDYYWDARYTGSKISVPVTIDGNNKTLTFTNMVYDAGNQYAAFRFEEAATVKNLTIDMKDAISGFGGRFRAISAKKSLSVDNCTFIGNGSANNTRAIIFGEGADAAILAETNIVVTNSKFEGWKRGVSDNENGKDVATVKIEENKFNDANVFVSAKTSVEFNNNEMEKAWVNITSYSDESALSVVAKENTLCENNTSSSSTMNQITNFASKDAQEGFVLPWDGVTISNLDELRAFRDAVNSGTDYTGKTVVMTADVDLTGEDWTPIGTSANPFTGTFDGQGHTISNLQVNVNGDAGLFGQVAMQTDKVTGTVQNLTVHNATIIAGVQNSAGVIAVAPLGARITNVKLTGNVTIQGYRGVGGIVGNGFPTINDCSVEAEGSITATYWGVGGILGFASDKGAKAFNSTVTATGNGLTIHGERGGVGAVTGTPHGAATNGATISGVDITSNNDYYMGYVDASGTVSGTVTVTDVAVKVSGEEIIGCDAVASIGDAIYFNFGTALNAAEDGDTITLLNDVELSGTISTTKSITLDGNNHKITPAADFVADGNSAALVFDIVKGTCTIKNLTFEGFDGLIRVVRVNQYNATIENCTFKNNSVSSGVITSAYATLDVKDCEFNGNTSGFAVVNIGFDVSDGTDVVANITGSTFVENEAAIAVIYLASSADVTDNYFSGNIHTGENANAAAVLAGPYTGSTSYTVNITKNAFENAMSKDENALPAVYTEDWNKGTAFDLSSNYWDGAEPVKGVAYKSNEGDPDVTIDNYYASYVNGELDNLISLAPVSNVAEINGVGYETLQKAIADAKEGDTINILAGTISEGTIKLPATLKNVTLKGEEGAILKDMTIMASDGNSFSYIGLTFDGITFDNSRLLFTGWRNGEEIIENLTVTNCTFKNLYDDTNSACVHINKDVNEPVNGFTFTNNVIDGATGGSKSGIYSANTGNVTITGNIFNNIVFRPALVQLADCDGIADNVVVSENVFSNTTRLQIYGTEEGPEGGPWTPSGTDALEIAINENIFSNISGYYICTWGINGETDITKNYYDNPELGGKIFWNNEKPTDEAGLAELGIYPIYTELNEDGTINKDSSYAPATYVAEVNGVGYETLQAAIEDAQIGDTITLLVPITVAADETLELNKAVTINYTSNVPGEDMITNRGNLVIDGATLVYTNTDTTANNVTVSTISCEAGSTLEVKSGTVKNDSANYSGIYAYAIDLLTNGNLGDVTATISGGEVISTNYMAIRQFNNGDACKNTLNVEGGYIYGAKRAIQVHLKNNAAYLTISDGKIAAGEDGYALCLYPENATHLTVSGGEFIGIIYSGTNGFISGGTFDEEPYEKYAAEGYVIKPNADGTYGVVEKEEPITEHFTLAGTNTSLESSLAFNFYLTKTAYATGNDYVAVFEQEKESEVITTEVPYSEWVLTENGLRVVYSGMAAKEMVDNVKLTVYDAEGNQVSDTFEKNMKEYATGMIDYIIDKDIQSLNLWLPALADMLNFGAGAQEMLGYRVDNLANAVADKYTSLASKTYNITNEGCDLPAELVAGTNVTLEDKTKLNIYFIPTAGVAKAKYSYTTHDGIYIENEVSADSFKALGNYLGLSIEEIAIADTDKLVKITMYDENDVELGTAKYSVDAHLLDCINANYPYAVYSAFAKFSASARKAFAK